MQAVVVGDRCKSRLCLNDEPPLPAFFENAKGSPLSGIEAVAVEALRLLTAIT